MLLCVLIFCEACEVFEALSAFVDSSYKALSKSLITKLSILLLGLP